MGRWSPSSAMSSLKDAILGLQSPCVSCTDSVSSRLPSDTRLSMPSSPNSPMVLRQLQELNPNHPEPEQHRLDPDSGCINPKCDWKPDPDTELELQNVESFDCPQCGVKNQVDPAPFGPGGQTRSGLTLDHMGYIGEEIVNRMKELPGVGVVIWTSAKNFPIDCIVESGETRYGCEVKTNHSEAQPRFKLGDRAERMAKIKFCMENGLKPALIGVRLNFFNDKANIFWREGLSDTWLGNKNMKHVLTVDFADLNPFQGSPVIKQRAIEDSHIPDQSNPDADIDAAFGPELVKTAVDDGSFEHDHPREKSGRFTFKDHVHEVKVVDKKGNDKAHIKRCKHCGTLYEKPIEYRGRFQCPTCGEDPERKLAMAKVIVASPLDQSVDFNAWQADGITSNGHRRYIWVDQTGYKHIIILGSGNHNEGTSRLDQMHAQQRMRQCMTSTCAHARNAHPTMAVQAEPQEGVWRPGDQVELNSGRGIVVDAYGGIAVVQDLATGQEDVLPMAELRAVAGAKQPDYMFVYYNSALKIEPWHHNKHFDDMLEDLLKEYGHHHVPADLDPGDVAAGDVFEYSDGSLKIEHKQLSRTEIREEADKAISDWVDDKEEVIPDGPAEDNHEPDTDADDEDDGMDFSEADDWRKLPRDEDGQWQSL